MWTYPNRGLAIILERTDEARIPTPKGVGSVNPQIHLRGEKYDAFAYDIKITTFAGDRIVVGQSCIEPVHRSTKQF